MRFTKNAFAFLILVLITGTAFYLGYSNSLNSVDSGIALLSSGDRYVLYFVSLIVIYLICVVLEVLFIDGIDRYLLAIGMTLGVVVYIETPEVYNIALIVAPAILLIIHNKLETN